MEKEERYLKERLEGQIVWYDKKSIFCQKCYKYTKIVIGLCAISLSPLAVLKVQYTDSLLVLIGALMAVLEYFPSINHFQERWLQYRTTCESLRREQQLYITQSDIYFDNSNAFHLLVERCENIIKFENYNWREFSKQQTEREKMQS